MHAALTNDASVIGYRVKFMGGPKNSAQINRTHLPRTIPDTSDSGGCYVRHEVDADTMSAVYKWKEL